MPDQVTPNPNAGPDATAPETIPSPSGEPEVITDDPSAGGGLFGQVQRQLDALKALVSQSGKRQAAIESQEAQVRQRLAEVEARERSLAERAEALAAAEGQVAHRQASLDEAERSLADRERAVAEMSEWARGQAEAMERARSEQVAWAAERERIESELRAALNDLSQQREARERAEASRGDAAARADAAQRDATDAMALAEQAERKAAAAQAALEALRAAGEQNRRDDDAAIRRVAELEAALSKREESIRALADRLREAETEAAKRREINPDDDPVVQTERSRCALRRVRLGRYKRLLAIQSAKIVKARAALQKRTSECESILAQRAKLAEAAAALEARQHAVQAKAAKSTAAAAVMYAVITLVAVAGGAWGLARQIAPATFAASAELSADGKGRVLLPHELAEWSSQMTALAQDPQVMAAAAENFARRGVPSLGTASAVKQRFGSLYVQSDKPGTLTIETRGQGAERTARDLETFLSAMLSIAGTQRETRGEGAATIISRPPTPGREPLDNLRMTYTLAIGGGGVVVAGLLGIIAYRRLRRAKERFEADVGELGALT